MSGAVPERIAAMILVSLMFPTTLTWVFGCFALYSSISDLNAFSSWVLESQPTQIVSFRFFDDPAFEPPPQAVSGRVARSSSAHVIATRLMVEPPKGERTITPCLPGGSRGVHHGATSLGFLTT